MQITVSGENPFKVLKDTFTIGPAESAYILKIAVEKDGDYTAVAEECPADEVHVVNGVTPFTWAMLDGNTGDVTVIL